MFSHRQWSRQKSCYSRKYLPRTLKLDVKESPGEVIESGRRCDGPSSGFESLYIVELSGFKVDGIRTGVLQTLEVVLTLSSSGRLCG